jgi:hypothetical protein
VDVFTFVVIVTAIGCSVPLFKTWIEGRQGGHANEERVAELRREVAALRERVQVLEEIATDEKHQLRREIASLGD